MKTGNPCRNNNDSTAVQPMTMDILENIMRYSDHPGILGEYLTRQIRGLEGARVIIILRHACGMIEPAHRVVSVYPDRYAELAGSPEIKLLAGLSRAVDRSVLWRAGEPPADAGEILSAMGYKTSMVVPLHVGNDRVGTLLVFDFLDTHHLQDILRGLDTLSTVVALVLRNSILYESQEAIIEAKTRDLAISRERYALAQKAANIGSWDWDIQGGALYWSEQIEPMFGIAPGEFGATYEAFLECVHPDDRRQVVDSIKACIEKGRDYEKEHRIVWPDGAVRWVLEKGNVVRDDKNRAVRMMGIVQDITERKRMEDELRQAHDELEIRVAARTGELAQTVEALRKEMAERKKLEQQLLQVRKMESIGILAGGVAHDFNNLLTSISGYGQILQDGIPADDRLLRESAEQVLKAARRAAELTRNLLAFSRKQIMNPTPIHIDAIINNTSELMRRIIGEDIELGIAFSEKKLLVMADAGQIEQVLINLATNARDAMPYGGRLSICTKRMVVKEGTEALNDLPAPGDYALISVADSGTGIDQETLEKLFEPFFTTKEVGKGTGLGLAIVYGIIKQHDGSILVSSRPGKGTTFSIYLPLIEGSVVREDTKIPAPFAVGMETLLVAEDEEMVKVFLKKILERAGYRVIIASDGEDAITRFKEHDDISLVLSDVVMPKKNGLEVVEEMKKIKPGIKVIFVSGYTADLLHKKGIVEEGVEFISKPFAKNDLLRKIREVLNKE
jgi:two-component system cell cycle sensor histidine kinase/response regulator CckA